MFLPFDAVPDTAERLAIAMRYLLEGVRTVFGKLGISTEKLDGRVDATVEHVCSHPEMLDNANLPGRN